MGAFSYFPQTGEDIRVMLERIGVNSLEELYADVPADFIYKGEYDLPSAMSEQQVRDFFEGLAAKNTRLKVFVGQGAYDHYTPSVIPYITSRSEFITAYTPYQCEISQGTLRYIFEWQSMICRLTGLDCANASMYDGPTAAAEAVRMCVASTKKRKSVIVSARLLPHVIDTIETYAKYAGINVVVTDKVQDEVAEGVLDLAGVIVPSINRFGVIESHLGLADLVHGMGALLVEYCDPSALAVVKSPAEWGADIAVGDGQSLGIPLCYGGPYVGFMACSTALMRKLPGRIVGQTTDASGKRCYVLTLQAREQHIRREMASSNICSNQMLCAIMASMYCAVMGPKGMKEVGEQNVNKAHLLAKKLTAIEGVKLRYPDTPFFNEFVIDLPDAEKVDKLLADYSITGGLVLPDGGMLWCATEMNRADEFDFICDVIENKGGEE